jgi:dTDP-4-dehydrorhamnose reductase
MQDFAMSKSILVIGRIGQIGYELARGVWPAWAQVDFVERDEVDLARPDTVTRYVAGMRPDIVVNAAAYTAVDQAESEPDMAFAVNRDGPAALADACRGIGAALIHFSTDYVFDGAKPAAYTEDDPVNPRSVYGASKAAGDAAIAERLDRHVILRTSWVYSAIGRNFVKTMLRLGAERDRLGVVDDQHGCPTAAADAAQAVIDIVAALGEGRPPEFGTFNFCGSGATTWHGFASAIFDGAIRRGLPAPRVVEPIATEAYPTPAARPANSVLDCGKIARAYGIVAPAWQASLARCLDEIARSQPQLQPVADQGALR